MQLPWFLRDTSLSSCTSSYDFIPSNLPRIFPKLIVNFFLERNLLIHLFVWKSVMCYRMTPCTPCCEGGPLQGVELKQTAVNIGRKVWGYVLGPKCARKNRFRSYLIRKLILKRFRSSSQIAHQLCKIYKNHKSKEWFFL